MEDKLKEVADLGVACAAICEALAKAKAEEAEVLARVVRLKQDEEKLTRIIGEKQQKLQGIETQIQKYREAAGA
jgi:chromosome segregation ATPase